MLRRLRFAAAPPRTGALLCLFPRLLQVRQHRAQLRVLIRRARQFTSQVASKVGALAWSNPNAALATFVSAFQREYFELDEAMCEQGFDFWVEAAIDFIPLLMRGTDRCNGLEPLGDRPGYALMWTLIEDVFYDDQRSQLIAEAAEAFGAHLADRLQAADPPEHRVLRHRLARTPYAGILAFSCCARRRPQPHYLDLGPAFEKGKPCVHVNDVGGCLTLPGVGGGIFRSSFGKAAR